MERVSNDRQTVAIRLRRGSNAEEVEFPKKFMSSPCGVMSKGQQIVGYDIYVVTQSTALIVVSCHENLHKVKMRRANSSSEI